MTIGAALDTVVRIVLVTLVAGMIGLGVLLVAVLDKIRRIKERVQR